MVRRLVSFAAACVTLAAYAGPVWAQTGYSFFGSASYVSPGNASNRAVKLTSDDTANPAEYSGVDFAIPSGLSIGSLNSLSTDYNFTDASCGQGSPRFGITLSGYPNKTIFVYIGPPPNYTNCPTGAWTSSGNLLTPSSEVDTSQFDGNPYNTWSNVQTEFAGQTITDIFLVSDAGPNGYQTVDIDNTHVNGTVYDYEFTNKTDCKNGGWQLFTYAPGPFPNQGACVSYFSSGK